MDDGNQRAPTISWKRLLKAASTLGAILSAASLLTAFVLKLLGDHTLPQYLSLVFLFTSPAYAGRLVVQGAAGYAKRKSANPHEQRLTRLYRASVGLLVAWVLAGLTFWRWHSAFWEMLAILTILILATWNACLIVDVLPDTNCQRGTNWLRGRAWFIRLRELMSRSGLLQKLEKSLGNITDESETSSFFDRLSLVLVILLLALAPFAGAEALKRLRPPAPTVKNRNTKHKDKAHPHPGGAGAATRPTATTKATTTSTATTITATPAETEPTYAEQCPNSLSALTSGSRNDVTVAVAESLLRVWQLEGASQAGCPGRAHQVPRHPSIWYAAGMCGRSLRSLGVYVPGQGSTLQYQQAASFGLTLANEGRLLNASSRGEIDGGNVYLFETPQGTYSLSRARAAAGQIIERPTNLWCERHASNNTGYTRTPPNATRAWREVDEQGTFTWPTLRSESNGERIYTFMSAGSEPTPLGTAVCINDQPCATWIDQRELPSAMTAPVTLGELRELAARKQGT